uniref:Si:dkey-26c10.5 n=1 Tax=Cyprinus carpio carpio TaxID=630221 RepID=A0A9J8B292_CYPCA
MESNKEVEVELEEIATVEEDKEKEDQKKETKAALSPNDFAAENVEEGYINSTLNSPSEHEYFVPSSTRSYTVNKVTGTRPCQEVEQTTRSLWEQKCSLERCQELYQVPQRLCSDCGKGWLRFENTCYFLSQNRLTWQQSRKECQRKGGDLAVITNERVQMYLNTKGNLHYWIGLNHLETNEWTWINNTALTVRYWGDVSFPGQCAILAGNEPPERSWRPSSCSLYLQYICQKM